MCAKTAPRPKTVQTPKPRKRQSSHSPRRSQSNDENQTPNNSIRSSPRKKQQNRARESDRSEVSLDFLGRPSETSDSSSNSPNASDTTNFSSNRGASNEFETPARRPPAPSNSSRNRKQAKPRHRKDLALREIKRYQSTTDLLMQRLPFQRLVREIMSTYGDFRIQTSALLALQESAECFLVQMFEDCLLCCVHRQRVTINEKDMRLVRNLRGTNDPSYGS